MAIIEPAPAGTSISLLSPSRPRRRPPEVLSEPEAIARGTPSAHGSADHGAGHVLVRPTIGCRECGVQSIEEGGLIPVRCVSERASSFRTEARSSPDRES